jgi:hypothetical protein
MAAKYCSACSINYPSTESKCRVCDAVLVHHLNLLPQPDWEKRVFDKWMEGVAETREFPILETGIVKFSREGGWLWAYDRDLRAAGMPTGFMKEDSLFELDGIVYELQGQDRPRRRWWIKRIMAVRGIALVLDGGEDGD